MPEPGELFRQIVNEYRPNDDIMRRDNDEMHELKHAIFDVLTDAERNILIAYAEVQSYTELSRMLGVGRMTAADEIWRIRAKIKEHMKTKGYEY